ncbi:MAG: hypothetical protein ACLGI6_23810, partial [Gammaproteobacteria bacterium]
NTPDAAPVSQRHPMAEQGAVPLVHVTHFNELYWDSGRAETVVIEHGVPDPGERYTGELARIGVVVNDPLRRGRVVGADGEPVPGQYVTGWIRRGPTGVIGTNKHDAVEVAAAVLDDLPTLPPPSTDPGDLAAVLADLAERAPGTTRRTSEVGDAVAARL